MMDTQALLSLLVFLVTFAMILSNRFDKAVAGLIGGMTMIVLGIVGEEGAYEAIDLSVIFLLTGMMIISHFLAESGFFGYVAVKFAQLAQGRPVPMMVLLCLVTGVLSALIDNVTTVVLVAPVTFLMAEQADVNPLPFLVFEVMAANIGGAATLIGDPPNILIGSKAGLSFNEFLFHVGPPALFCLVLSTALAVWAIRKNARVSADVRARIMEMNAARAINNRPLLVKSSVVLALVLVAFTLHDVTGVGPAPMALMGAAVLLLITRADSVTAFRAVEWPTLFFFIGLFVTVAGLVASGMIGYCADASLHLTGGNLGVTTMFILWFSAVSSAVVGAIPMVTALIPVIQDILPSLEAGSKADPETIRYALWWSLSLGACLGSNATVLGAAANIVVVDIARNNRRDISFLHFMKVGIPVTLLTLTVSTVYVWVRYLL